MSAATTGTRSFDLVDQPWLQAHDLDGTVRELSLIEVYQQAHRLRGLAGEVPTQVFALTRMLLAVLHRAVDGPRDRAHWQELWKADGLPTDEIRGYLDRHRHRFDLFEPTTPFLQVAGLRTAKGEVSDLAKLIADIPNGHRFFSTRHGSLTLGFGEAARWLVHCHAYDLSGIKSGAEGDTRVKGGKGYPIGTGWCGYLGGVMPEGRTLRETLLLNLIPHDQHDDRDPARDLPPWERDVDGPAERADPTPKGPVDLLTWQSRRIRLVPDGEVVTGVLICNGDRITPQNMHRSETHSGWRRSKAQETKRREPTVYMPLEHQPERMIWRGLQSLLPSAPDTATAARAEAAPRLRPTVLRWLDELTTNRLLNPDALLRIRVFGMTYGPQSSTTTEVVDDALALHTVLMSTDASHLVMAALSAVAAAENAAYALGSFAANLAVASGEAGQDKGKASRTRALEAAYAVLDPHFREWIATLTSDTDITDCQVAWHKTAHREIRSVAAGLLAAAPPNAVAGHVDPVTKRLVTSAHADVWFGSKLREALPYAYDTEQDT